MMTHRIQAVPIRMTVAGMRWVIRSRTGWPDEIE